MLLNKYYEGKIEAGCDEAGRGCLAGSVYAAAVILPEGYQNELLNDSKQLSEKKRYQLREIIERDAVAWAVGIVTPEEIDKINILNASILAMHRALDQLKVRPEAIIVDGNRFKPYKDPADGKALPSTTIVKGDGKYLAIAAAKCRQQPRILVISVGQVLKGSECLDFEDELHDDGIDAKSYPKEALVDYRDELAKKELPVKDKDKDGDIDKDDAEITPAMSKMARYM